MQGEVGASFVIGLIVVSRVLAPAGVCLQSVARASFVCVLVVVSGVGANQYNVAECGKS